MWRNYTRPVRHLHVCIQYVCHRPTDPQKTISTDGVSLPSDIMGKYLYVTGHDAKQMNSTAVIKSPPFSLDKESNMTFWYSMNGVGIGQLILSKWVEGQKTEIWSRKGRQGSDWMEGAVVLKPGNMSLEFSATTTFHYGSDLALDDIHLQTEPRGMLHSFVLN